MTTVNNTITSWAGAFNYQDTVHTIVSTGVIPHEDAAYACLVSDLARRLGKSDTELYAYFKPERHNFMIRRTV
jgi:hypothetical protein